MRIRGAIALLAILIWLVQPASADCKYFKNAQGFPLGIIPTPNNITVDFKTPAPQNVTFYLYIEAELGTTVSQSCSVELTLENQTYPLKIELSNYALDTGFGFNEKPIVVMLTPANLVNYPSEIHSQIKITDLDQRFNYAILPVNAKFGFSRQPTTLPAGASPTPIGGPVEASFIPFSSLQPEQTNDTGLLNTFGKVQDSTSKYLIAIIAFFFLAALLWVGFNSLQRD